ncbi:proline-rich extensin-like family protein [Actinidia rufa]|uniref:Proline-rich extensin-like family protein n=1 Tax=Actinidia rufa TaxID=165716 RepID=A0A7J0EI75_9ERIC|nr:proline-rich extensin-like family protein [Actinidia rufa]
MVSLTLPLETIANYHYSSPPPPPVYKSPPPPPVYSSPPPPPVYKSPPPPPVYSSPPPPPVYKSPPPPPVYSSPPPPPVYKSPPPPPVYKSPPPPPVYSSPPPPPVYSSPPPPTSSQVPTSSTSLRISSSTHLLLHTQLPHKIIGLMVLYPGPSVAEIELELNRAQLLVHDNATLNKFKTNQGIPRDGRAMILNQSDAGRVDGTLSPYLHAIGEGVSSPFMKGNHYLRLRNPRQHQTWLVTDNSDKDLFLEKSLERRLTSSSSSYASFESSSSEKDKGEEVVNRLIVTRQRKRVPHLAEPKVLAILISSSDNEHSDDLTFAPLQLAGAVKTTHSFREGYNIDESSVSLPAPDPVFALSTQVGFELSSSKAPLKRKRRELTEGPSKKSKKKAKGSSSAYLLSSSGNVELWKPEFSIAKLDKQVMVVDYTKDHDTSLALTQVVRLPKDVVNLVEEGSKEIKNLFVMQQVKASILTPDGWLACLRELSVPLEHPAWKAIPPTIELMDPPQAYSPLMLPGFDEEEMLEEEVDEILEKNPKVVGSNKR